MGQIIDTDGLALYDQEYVMPLISSVAPVENGSTASQAYSEGDELILNNILYKAISAIAQGGDLIPSGTGQNIDLAGTIVGQLKDMFGDISSILSTIARQVPYVGNLTNLNISNSSGVRFYMYTNNSQNIPENSYGYLLDLSFSTTDSIQIAFCHNTSYRIYFRTKAGNTWRTWAKINTDNIGSKYDYTVGGANQSFTAGVKKTYTVSTNVPAGQYILTTNSIIETQSGDYKFNNFYVAGVRYYAGNSNVPPALSTTQVITLTNNQSFDIEITPASTFATHFQIGVSLTKIS